MKGKWIVGLGLALTVVAGGIWRGSARAEEIVVYTALEDDEYPGYLELFKKKYPNIQVRIVRDSTGIITAKFLAEKENPQADVIWGLAATSLLVADQAGLLVPYAPKGLERVKPMFRDAANPPKWVGIKCWETGIIVNTVEAEKRKLAHPKSFADLIKPEYKGLLVMPHPASSGTGYLTVSAILQLMGEERGWAYMDRLHENMMAYTHSGSKPARMAGAGECAVGISFGYRGLKQKAKGEPVVTYWPAEGAGWDVEANALVKKAKIKEGAKTFLDWAIGDEVMKLYAAVYPITSVETGLPVPEGYPADPLKVLISNNLVKAAADRDRILAEWTKRYDGKSQPK